jgi:RNA polymerase sigma factor (sigma-70 family)
MSTVAIDPSPPTPTATAIPERAPAELVAAARAGHALAWRQLIEAYEGLLWRTVRSFRLPADDANDVIQETWLRALTHLGQLKDPERIGGWLAMIASRECLRHIARGRREVVTDDFSGYEPTDALESPERTALRAGFARIIADISAHLTQRERHLLEAMSSVAEPRYAEIARKLDMPLGSIGPTRMRCLRRVRTLLDQRGVRGDFFA